MIKFIKLICLFFLFFNCSNNEINWQKVEKVIIYEKEGLNHDKKELSRELSYEINTNLFKDKITKAEPFNSMFIWKGHHLCKATLDNNKTIYFKISKHGDMIYSIHNKMLYKLPTGSNAKIISSR
ncbi:hypothetical protein [Olleya namhaensis]|uniref:hypothetical protein n=1 Tax=Olleya namhaensis TaxID=1144750 RepID=UPI0024900247|nr:hypothetical protein [Olleya namhaensis]